MLPDLFAIIPGGGPHHVVPEVSTIHLILVAACVFGLWKWIQSYRKEGGVS